MNGTQDTNRRGVGLLYMAALRVASDPSRMIQNKDVIFATVQPTLCNALREYRQYLENFPRPRDAGPWAGNWEKCAEGLDWYEVVPNVVLWDRTGTIAAGAKTVSDDELKNALREAGDREGML